MKILTVPKNWKTPAYKYSLKEKGCARIIASQYEPDGFYHMEKVNGYDYFEVEETIRVTELQINGVTVMIDDPLHWIGMQSLAKACKGKVLVAGLGLGLIVHALQKNPNVTLIDIVEKEKDVIDLIGSVSDVLKDSKTHVFHTEIGSFITGKNLEPYDNVILDIWWGNGTMEMQRSMKSMVSLVSYFIPNATPYVWGLRSKLNPACKLE